MSTNLKRLISTRNSHPLYPGRSQTAVLLLSSTASGSILVVVVERRIRINHVVIIIRIIVVQHIVVALLLLLLIHVTPLASNHLVQIQMLLLLLVVVGLCRRDTTRVIFLAKVHLLHVLNGEQPRPVRAANLSLQQSAVRGAKYLDHVALLDGQVARVALRVRYHAHDRHVRVTDRAGGAIRTGRPNS